jgi:hypothetical protein
MTELQKKYWDNFCVGEIEPSALQTQNQELIEIEMVTTVQGNLFPKSDCFRQYANGRFVGWARL